MHPRAPASAAALVALGGVAGAVTFLVARDDHPAPPAVTTTTAPARDARPDEVAAAIAGALRSGLEVRLTPVEAACVTDGLLEVVGPARAASWVTGSGEPLASDEEVALVRVVVRCLPDGKAAALLGEPTTTTDAQDLPDE